MNFSFGTGIRFVVLLLQKRDAQPAVKLVLAGWLYGQTTVNRRGVAERLGMGYETRVSQAISLVESSRQGAIQALKKKLSQ